MSATSVSTSKVNLLFETVNSIKVEVSYKEQGSLTPSTQSIGVSFNVFDILSDRNVEGVGIDSSTC